MFTKCFHCFQVDKESVNASLNENKKKPLETLSVSLHLWHFGPLPPPCYVSPSLSLSSLLLQRHMALGHANHSLITSHIPWNTSSSLFLHVVPGSQSSPPTHTHTHIHTNPHVTHPLFPSPAPTWCLSLGVCGSHSREP